MKPYVYDAQDQMSPVYCLSCRAHIPRAVSNAQAGFCNACHVIKNPPPHSGMTPPPIPPHIPWAPTPPTILEQIFVPFANQKYQAELGAYLHATGQVSDQAKKTANVVTIIGGICIVLIMLTSTISILRIFTGHDPEIQKFDAEMERIRKRAAIEGQHLEEERRKLDEEYQRYRAEEERRDAQAEARQAEEMRRAQEEFDRSVRESIDHSRSY